MAMRIFLLFILILFVFADPTWSQPPPWANPGGGNDGGVVNPVELDVERLTELQEEHNMLLREQSIGFQYLLGIAAILCGIVLGYLFLSGLKLR
jgi:hypothetical protein